MVEQERAGNMVVESGETSFALKTLRSDILSEEGLIDGEFTKRKICLRRGSEKLCFAVALAI